MEVLFILRNDYHDLCHPEVLEKIDGSAGGKTT